jgi:hypothetical protein
VNFSANEFLDDVVMMIIEMSARHASFIVACRFSWDGSPNSAPRPRLTTLFGYNVQIILKIAKSHREIGFQIFCALGGFFPGEKLPRQSLRYE